MTSATERRRDRETPYWRDHERTEAARHPQSLRDHLRELRAAVDAESVDRLHSGGSEYDQGTTVRMRARAIIDGTDVQRPVDNVVQMRSAWLHESNPIDTPRWSHDFRTYLSGSPFATYPDGAAYYWVRPLQSSIARMENDGSGVTRLAARAVHALPFHRYRADETWWYLCGPFAYADAEYMAESWIGEALRRWYTFYVEQPRGKPLT